MIKTCSHVFNRILNLCMYSKIEKKSAMPQKLPVKIRKICTYEVHTYSYELRDFCRGEILTIVKCEKESLELKKLWLSAVLDTVRHIRKIFFLSTMNRILKCKWKEVVSPISEMPVFPEFYSYILLHAFILIQYIQHIGSEVFLHISYLLMMFLEILECEKCNS